MSKKVSNNQKKAPKRHIKKGDKVMIIAGKDKGSEGTVLRVFPADYRALVEGKNLASKHVKPQQDQPGGINEIEQPIHLSNLMVIDSAGNATRTGRKVENGKLVRYSKKSGEILK